MSIVRTEEGLDVYCNVCGEYLHGDDVQLPGTTEEIFEQMRREGWSIHPAVCCRDADRIRVWKGGNPFDQEAYLLRDSGLSREPAAPGKEGGRRDPRKRKRLL